MAKLQGINKMDTQMYNQAANSGKSMDPLSEAAKLIQLRNLAGNLNKNAGTNPSMEDSLGALGAGEPYQPTGN